MSALSFAAFLSLALPGGAGASEAPALPDCVPRPRHVLSSEMDGQVIELCISPERSTVLVSDSPLLPGSVRLTGSERFLDLAIGSQSITLLPRKDLKPWERFELTVGFADGMAPMSVNFVLLGHPAAAARQVEVFRHPRTMASFQQEAREARAEVLRYQEENARLRAELGRPDGLLGVLASNLVDDTGLLARSLIDSVSQAAEGTFRLTRIVGYRTSRPMLDSAQQGQVRLALELELLNKGKESWRVEGAAMFGPQGEMLEDVRVWQESPAEPGGTQRVFVEVEVPSPQVQGSYTLTLWDASGSRTVTLRDVTFP